METMQKQVTSNDKHVLLRRVDLECNAGPDVFIMALMIACILVVSEVHSATEDLSHNNEHGSFIETHTVLTLKM